MGMNKEDGTFRRIIWSKWMIGVLILVFAVVGFFLGLGASGIVNAGGFWEWANTYSGVLSFFASVILVGVTISYVIFTHSMAKASEKSLEQAKEQTKLLSKQIQLDKLPCIVAHPSSLYHHEPEYGPYLEKGGWKFGIDVYLRNHGNSPATSIITVGYIELQYANLDEKVLKMNGGGGMVTFLSHLAPQSTQQIPYDRGSVSLYFDEKTLSLLISDMTECKRQHPEYSLIHPMSAFYGPVFVIQVVYKNLLGVWFMGVSKVRIKSLEGCAPSSAGVTRCETIPPDTPSSIINDLIYKVNFSSDESAEAAYRQVSEDDVKKLLSDYSDIPSIPSNLFEDE
ncbi:MAG: hypothetical protein WC248_05965 [Candidatus Methanomethylophilaceae archaeon]